MSDTRARWANPTLWLLAILLFAAVARLTHVDWDQNHHFHPDERAVVSAVQRISLQPLRLNPEFFAYGSLPIYLTRVTSGIASLVNPSAATYDGIVLEGRRLSGMLGTLTVLLLVLLGKRLYDRNVGLLAGVLLAACALHIQNSRFLTVDVPLTFFVLLALTVLVRVSREGRGIDFVLGGAAIGLAVATKFSAMPLMLPLAIAALHRCLVEQRWVSVAARTALAVLAAAAAFAVAQPYALIDFPRFYHDVLEQSHMVRNAGLYPYTNQYLHTPKYGYELLQLVLWGMAPALGVVAVWASATRPVLAWRQQRAEEWILLAWVIPFFLISGWFEVKFPRYLLPIYPLMILWAAEWLVRKYRGGTWIGRLLAPLVVVGTIAAAFAYMSIYTRPHTVVTASEWFYRHVPPGSKVLSQNWDEGFPFGLPGRNPSAYRLVEFGYYELPDGSTKMQQLANELATSDFIVFQTKRLYGAVTRAPEKYPRTTNYFYELFAGDLGYTLIHEVASRPSLFGFEFPDELADESLTVYDHPKVLVFRNDGHLPAAVIFDRIMNGLPSRPLTRDDILNARPAGASSTESGRAEPISSGPLATVLFIVVVEALGLAMYPLLRGVVGGVGSLALSKTLGVVVFAYASWILVSVRVAGFTQGTLLAVAGALVIVGLVVWRRGRVAPVARGEAVATEALFLGAFAFFLVVRMYNPEVFWGEKPMDFSFLNALMRATTLPPPEPWFAGSPLNYSYFGYYTIAALGKLVHVHPALLFNLGIALVGGLTAVAAFAVGAVLSRQWQTGLLAAVLVALVGNLAGPRELLGPHPRVNFDYFWATSRVIKDTINEYPFWSLLFADLHAHVMVMPISLTFICLTIVWGRARFIDRESAHPAGRLAVLLGLLALTLGTITVTNAWSTPVYVLLFPFVVGALWLTEGRHAGVLRFVWGGVKELLLPAGIIVAGANALFWPFWANFTPPERNLGWERLTIDKLVQPEDFLTIWGLSLFAIVPFLLILWTRDWRRDGRRLGLADLGLVAGAVLVLFAAGIVSTRVFALTLFILSLQVLLAPRTEARWRLPAALAAFAFAITAGCDLVYVWDRMNTLFKFYLESWFLLATASAVAARALWSGEVALPGARRLWQLGFAVLGGVALFTAATDTYAVIHTNRVVTPKPTLDGMAYLRTRAPDELAAYEWLNRNIQGIPVLLEAHGDSYQEFTRVSMNTGLPTVLGWGYHVFQRAHSWNEINRRKADVQAVYTSDSKDTIAAILDRYHVALVFVGGLERRVYAGANLERFTQWTDLLTPLYQNPGVTVFAVNGRFAGTMPVTTIEELPQAPGGAPEEAAPAPDAPGVLHQPRGVAVNPEGNVVVCDFGNSRIQEFGRDLTFIRAWGSKGELPGQFKEPCGIAVAPSGEFVVADTWNQRVQVFGKDGTYIREFGMGFFGPRGIAVDGGGSIFVSDTGNHRIVRFSPQGLKEIEWGRKGSAPGQFFEPAGVAADAAGQVYVCDNGNGRLQIFTRDGDLVSAFSVAGWESVVYSEPTVTLDPEGHIWVTVPTAKQVRAYDRTGKLLRTIASGSVSGVTFETPMGIAYSAAAKALVVSDLENRLLQIPVAGR